LDAASARNAEDRERAAPTPLSPPAREPLRLLPDANQVAQLVPSRLGLDRECDARRRYRHGVDIPRTAPPEPVPDPSSLRFKPREHTPHLGLRLRPHPAATSQAEPVARIQPKAYGREQE
jgi:hypothetical protein